MQCDRCGGEEVTKAGRDRYARQRYRYRAYGRRRTTRPGSAFSGYRFPDEVIALAVRWYLRFRLSYADLAALVVERSVHVDPSTIFDWVLQFTPISGSRVLASPSGRAALEQGRRSDQDHLVSGAGWRTSPTDGDYLAARRYFNESLTLSVQSAILSTDSSLLPARDETAE